MSFIKNLLSKNHLRNIRASFRKIEGELNEHRESINANTNEIQSLYELFSEVEQKVDKLSSRIDELQMKVEPDKRKKIFNFKVDPLTKREKEVFFTLYTAHDEQLTYDEVARKTGFDEVMVQEYITNLIAKGVPISKKFKNKKIFVSLDKEFKEAQAKENLIENN